MFQSFKLLPLKLIPAVTVCMAVVVVVVGELVKTFGQNQIRTGEVHHDKQEINTCGQIDLSKITLFV
jgi:hypothetical protein